MQTCRDWLTKTTTEHAAGHADADGHERAAKRVNASDDASRASVVQAGRQVPTKHKRARHLDMPEPVLTKLDAQLNAIMAKNQRDDRARARAADREQLLGVKPARTRGS